MKRITRWHILLFLGVAIFLAGLWSFFDQDSDTFGAPVGDTIPLHIARHLFDMDVIFDEVARRPEAADGITLSVKLSGAHLPPTITLYFDAWTQPNSMIYGTRREIIPNAVPGTDSFRVYIPEFSNSAEKIHWSLKFDNEQRIYFTTPNPGKTFVSKGFVAGPSTVANGDQEMTLKSFSTEITAPTGKPPFPGFWKFTELQNWYSALWDDSGYTDSVSSLELGLVGNPAGWALRYCTIEPNLGMQADDLRVDNSDPDHFLVPMAWPEDGPFKITAWAFHEQSFSPTALQKLTVPKPGEVIHLNATYSVGSASVTFDTLSGASKDAPCLVFHLNAPFFHLEGIPGANSDSFNPQSSTEMNKVPLFGPPGTEFSISFIMADEARQFQFIATPVINRR